VSSARRAIMSIHSRTDKTRFELPQKARESPLGHSLARPRLSIQANPIADACGSLVNSPPPSALFAALFTTHDAVVADKDEDPLHFTRTQRTPETHFCNRVC
jgi:hypothetical protein